MPKKYLANISLSVVIILAVTILFSCRKYNDVGNATTDTTKTNPATGTNAVVTGSYDKEVQYFKNFLTQRVNWMNANMAGW